ncbi:hypothetical protein ALQ04_200046 [Pseudomonas cichorii]|uniref:Uncharacterized protein n=1 Tax=Pseudomonas cichorii TaxID=36746 RepID=A0A3M4LDW6_PSECI|nr:hypothetical protein ALQ04_200046 [Pseudomonas cichorii]
MSKARITLTGQASHRIMGLIGHPLIHRLILLTATKRNAAYQQTTRVNDDQRWCVAVHCHIHAQASLSAICNESSSERPENTVWERINPRRGMK